jgi:hypothetical protein
MPFPLREHGAALRDALAGGVLQLVGTDHAVFNSSQKRVGRHDFRLIPNGVNGIEVGARLPAPRLHTRRRLLQHAGPAQLEGPYSRLEAAPPRLDWMLRFGGPAPPRVSRHQPPDITNC